MKKLVFACLLFGFLFAYPETIQADTGYQSYESITLSEGKLLENYTKDEYKDYYTNVDTRKFLGWRIHKVNSNVKVSYISETLFSYYNDGYTAIDYTYKLDRKVTSKLGLSASGTIGVDLKNNKKVFSFDLEAQLKLTAEYTISSEDKESIEINLKVDPGTQVDLYIYGEGKITNGVAARYVFWIRANRGGFEVFLVTTQYQRLEKVRI